MALPLRALLVAAVLASSAPQALGGVAPTPAPSPAGGAQGRNAPAPAPGTGIQPRNAPAIAPSRNAPAIAPSRNAPAIAPAPRQNRRAGPAPTPAKQEEPGAPAPFFYLDQGGGGAFDEGGDGTDVQDQGGPEGAGADDVDPGESPPVNFEGAPSPAVVMYAGLSAGAVAGIVIGTLLGVLLLVAFAWLCLARSRNTARGAYAYGESTNM